MVNNTTWRCSAPPRRPLCPRWSAACVVIVRFGRNPIERPRRADTHREPQTTPHATTATHSQRTTATAGNTQQSQTHKHSAQRTHAPSSPQGGAESGVGCGGDATRTHTRAARDKHAPARDTKAASSRGRPHSAHSMSADAARRLHSAAAAPGRPTHARGPGPPAIFDGGRNARSEPAARKVTAQRRPAQRHRPDAR